MNNEFRIKVDHENLTGKVLLDGVELATFDLSDGDYSLTRMATVLAGFYEETQGTLIRLNEAMIERLSKVVVRSAGIALGREMENIEPDIRLNSSGKLVVYCYPIVVESVGCGKWKAHLHQAMSGNKRRPAAVSGEHGGYGYALAEVLGVPCSEIIKVD